MLKIKELASFCLAMPEKINNEDACLNPRINKDGCVYFAVADGVGSLEGADNASTIAIGCLLDELNNANVNLDDVFIKTKLKLDELSILNKEFSRAATTLTIIKMCDEKLEIAHVGDSRVYYKDEKNRLKQLTKDHSKYQELIDSKEHSLKKLREHKDRLSRVLTKAISKDYEIEYEKYSYPLHDLNVHGGSLFLYAMTDGAYNHWEKRPRFSENSMASPVIFASSLKKRIERQKPEDDYTLITVSISI
ncbi:PP2C family protein-serine/threonine phosphatase [Pantoea dispersa]|uniref:Phosphatase 2C family protein n=1 Tax=Pantoea dispersa TaxID=59814 RepID=A0ABY2ZTQ6_9GAMM|nr:protein phosphatase 2C domain-containing protein [Pantoea dispersa]TQC70010.1 phosphatase 2C family protein [Pantoea dispersa]